MKKLKQLDMKQLLLFCGALVTSLMSVAQVSFYVNPPSTNSGNYTVNSVFDPAEWGSPDMSIPANAVDDTLVIVQGTDSLGCAALTNGASVTGNIAVVFRGDCEFGLKAINAQNAGAIAVVIVNNDPNQQPTAFTMLGGADGLNVTIPVVMIGTATGQLIYDEIQNGLTVTAFIGNKLGYFPNDLGIAQKDVLRARQFAMPLLLAGNDSEFSVPLGSWVYNFGANDQTNVTLNATVEVAGNVIYNETSTPIASLISGDSAWIPLPTFSETTYLQDYYSIVYTAAADATDDFSDDNALNADFVLTETEYAYSTVDPVTALPVPQQFFQPGTFSNSFGNCVHFRDANASRLAVKGLTFSATSAAETSLQDELIALEAYEWNDAVTDFNDAGFNGISTIDFIGSGEFTFTTDSQQVAIYVPFDDIIELTDNQNYIFCAVSLSPNVFLGYDNTLDYDENIRGADLNGVFHGTGHVSTMVNNDNAYTPLGFGTDLASAVMINMLDATELSVEEEDVQLDAAFPNPAVNMLTVPLNGLSGTGILNILDLSGKIIFTDNVNLSDSKLMVDVSEFAAGMYVFNLNLENGKTTTFNVVVSK